jgi:hypothetical protein
MTGTALALSPVPTSPILRCAISTPYFSLLSPLSPVPSPLLLFFSSRSKDEVLPSGVSP